jgi:hypothetical protein
MTAELIFRTKSLEALIFWEHFEAKREERRKLIAEYIAKLTADFGPTAGSEERNVWTRGVHVYGVDCNRGEQPPADSGWRLDAKDGIWMPKLRTKAGQDRRDELRTLTVYDVTQHVHEIGIPSIIFTSAHLFRPGLDFHEGSLYQLWGSGECRDDILAAAATNPAVVWEPVKRSEWYALQEAREAEKAGVAS